MTHKVRKQVCSLTLCTLIMTQVLCASVQLTNNDITLRVNDCAENPGEVLVYGNKSITAGQFLQKGIQPIRVKISNNGDKPVIVSSKSILKEQVDANQAARLFHGDNQFTRSLFLDACLISTGVNIFAWGGPWAVFSVFAGFLPGSAVGAIYWLYVRGNNKALNQAFNSALAEQNRNGECVIQPGSSTTQILLLKKEHRIPRFTFCVFDEQDKQAVASFDIALDN